jgi:hypothetical protein
LQPVIRSGRRDVQISARVSERDRKGLNRLLQFFSYASLADLFAGLGSGGLLRRVHAAAASEFVTDNRASIAALTAERDHWRLQAQSQTADIAVVRASIPPLQERCRQLESALHAQEAAAKQGRLESDYRVRRAEANSAELVRKVDELTVQLAREKSLSQRLKPRDDNRKKNERNKAWVREEIARLGRKRVEVNRALQQRRRAAVLETRRRGTSYRNAKVREVLEDMLEKIKVIVGTGEDAEEDEKRALEAMGRAFSIKSGKRSLTAHAELMVPSRVKDKLQEEGKKAVFAWMRTPGRWAEVMDVADISFSRATKLAGAFPPGAKPANKDIILSKKKLNHVMQIINPIKETPGGNGHQVELPTLLSLLVPLWLD